METSPALIAGRYHVIRPLGEGSFARTLLARDVRDGGLVAVKVFHPHRAADWKAYDLFEREAAVLRSLGHHGIPAVRESVRGEWEGVEVALLAMEFIDGTSLAEVIAERRHLSEDELLGVFVEMLGILDYLHSCVPPVLHRDIKPANIILRPGGVPALVDFGAVRNVFRTADESGSTVAGTYGYMPYEQYMGQATPASDLYALGATFLHLITGRPPPEFIAGEGRIEVPASLPGDPLLREILVRLLRPSPADRFGDAGEVRRILLRQRGISGTPQAADTGEGAIVSPMNSRRTVSGIAIPISCCP